MFIFGPPDTFNIVLCLTFSIGYLIVLASMFSNAKQPANYCSLIDYSGLAAPFSIRIRYHGYANASPLR